MKKLLCFSLLLLLLFTSGCSNSHSSSDVDSDDEGIAVSNAEQNADFQENYSGRSPDWFSSFSWPFSDEGSNNPFFFIDESYTMKDIIRLYEDDISNIDAEKEMPSVQCRNIELFGVSGALKFDFVSSVNFEEYNQRIEDVMFYYYYPSLTAYLQEREAYLQDVEAYNQDPQGDAPNMPTLDIEEPTVEDMQAAQSFMTYVVSSFTEIYGEPAISKPGHYVWNLSDDYFQRYISVGKQNADYITGNVFVWLAIDDWDGRHFTADGEEIG